MNMSTCELMEGMEVRKEFDGTVYLGYKNCIDHDVDHNDQLLYNVMYEDGDCEHMRMAQ